jgi:hypothetical protein
MSWGKGLGQSEGAASVIVKWMRLSGQRTVCLGERALGQSEGAASVIVNWMRLSGQRTVWFWGKGLGTQSAGGWLQLVASFDGN